jgi:hypothetical protein
VLIPKTCLAVERKEIIEWLSPINFFLRHADISQARQHGTEGWLHADPHFQEWEAGSGRTLWCHGIRVWLTFLSFFCTN